MRTLIFALSTLFAAGSACVAHAQSGDELTCQDLTIPIVGVPDSVPLTFTVPADDLIKRCTSSAGSPIMLISPTNDITFTPAPGSSLTFIFIVKDDEGHTAVANLTITRDQGNG